MSKDPRFKVKCLRCNFEWFPRVPSPKRCLKCGSSAWDKLKTARKK